MLRFILGLLILGILFLYFPTFTKKYNYSFPIQPYFKKNCAQTLVQCIDTCNLLCSDQRFICQSNICQLPEKDQSIECNTDNGGMIILEEISGIPIWKCVCKYPLIFNGPLCEIQSDKTCENGTITVYNENKFSCTCPSDKVLLLKGFDNLPHCLSKEEEKLYIKTFPLELTKPKKGI